MTRGLYFQTCAAKGAGRVSHSNFSLMYKLVLDPGREQFEAVRDPRASV